MRRRKPTPGTNLTNAFRIAVSQVYGLDTWLMRVNVAPSMKDGYFIKGAPKGTSDLVGVVHGRAVAFEVKAGKDQIKEWQEEFRISWIRAGGIHLVVRAVKEALLELAQKLNDSQFGKI